jgi:hypothetical protein
VRYLSRLGDEVENWALLESYELDEIRGADVGETTLQPSAESIHARLQHQRAFAQLAGLLRRHDASSMPNFSFGLGATVEQPRVQRAGAQAVVLVAARDLFEVLLLAVLHPRLPPSQLADRAT